MNKNGNKTRCFFCSILLILSVFFIYKPLPGKRDVRSENGGRTVKNNYLHALKIQYVLVLQILFLLPEV